MRYAGSVIVTVWTVSWFASLLLSGAAGRVADIVCGAAGFLLVVEVAASWRRSNDRRAWLRRNWHELVFLVPVFRGLRFMRVVRRSRLLMKVCAGLDTVVEGVDIALRTRLAAFVRGHAGGSR